MSTASRVVVSASVMLAATVIGACDIGRSDGTAPPSKQAAARKRPRLVDLGAGKCIPCRAMAPILEEFKAEYAGRMDVQFIDVWKDPDAARPYGIHIIRRLDACAPPTWRRSTLNEPSPHRNRPRSGLLRDPGPFDT